MFKRKNKPLKSRFKPFTPAHKYKKLKQFGHWIALFMTLIFYVIVDYVTLPAYNLHSFGFLLLIAITLAVWATLDQLFTLSLNRVAMLAYVASGLIIAIASVLSLLSSEFLNARRYRDQIVITEIHSFSDDFEAVDLNKVPVLDKTTAIQLGEKQIGKVASLGSQYFVDDDYTLLAQQDEIYRIAALDYRDFIKWFNNRKTGITSFVSVNVTNPNDVKLVDYPQGMRYTPKAYFNDNLLRKVRFNHRSAILGGFELEVDEDFKPFWVFSVVEPEIGWFGGFSAKGVIILDPSTGESIYYDLAEVPDWVDRVQPTEIAWAQIYNWGYYVNGFFNTLFSQKEMLQTTEGYNYVLLDNNIYVFSGITSIGADNSIVGFALINLKTKEAIFYHVGGADEYSAMNSAQGQVQHLNYKSTFPVLLNVGNVPSYFMSLKDQEGLVKKYAFVAVSNYDAVGVGDSIQEALNDFGNRLGDFNIIIDEPGLIETLQGTINEVYSVIDDGDTIYYMTLHENPRLFKVVAKDHVESIFATPDDKVEISFYDSEALVVEAIHFDHLGVNYYP